MTYKCLCHICNISEEYPAPINHCEDDIPKCPKCGAKRSKIWINPVTGSGFILKGSGWHAPGGFSISKKEKI